MNLRRVFAIARRHLLQSMRFRWDYIFGIFLGPLKLMLLFFFIYTGFFYSGARNIGGVTTENYIVFLALGTVMSSIFGKGYNAIRGGLRTEKWWQTAEGLLVSPATRLDILLGYGIASLIHSLPMFIMVFTFAYIIMPVPLLNLIYIIALMLAMYAAVLGVGLVYGAFALTNENYNTAFSIASSGILFLSCFFYPMVALPGIFHPLIKVNPIYLANHAVKSAWMQGTIEPKILVFMALASIASVSLGVHFFNRIWKRKGIQGY